jgi:hypothetical protein
MRSEALQGATGQNPGSENLEGVTEKVGTLGLQGQGEKQEVEEEEQEANWIR